MYPLCLNLQQSWKQNDFIIYKMSSQSGQQTSSISQTLKLEMQPLFQTFKRSSNLKGLDDPMVQLSRSTPKIQKCKSQSSGSNPISQPTQQPRTMNRRRTQTQYTNKIISSQIFKNKDGERIIADLLSHLSTKQNKSHVIHSRINRGLSLMDQNQEIFESIEFSSFIVWFLLIINAINNAIVPCWMTHDIHSQGIIRSAWRLFNVSILLIPFVMYEQRNTTDKKQKFINLLNRQNLQANFICSINYCVWVLFGAMAIKLTARSHSFCFLRLKFYFISIFKFATKEAYHQAEMGGVFLVTIGILMALWDSIFLPTVSIQEAYYLQNTPLQRLFGDLIAIGGALVILYFDSHYKLPKTPRFSNLFIYNICTMINLITFGYFFGGDEFSFDPTYGVMGLFTEQNYVSIFYVSIMLGINLVVGNILVDKLFSEFIRNVSSCFQIIITTLIYHVFSIEIIYSGITSLGFAFLIPGMMLIVGGQNNLQNKSFGINFSLYKQEEENMKRSNQIARYLLENPQNSIQELSMKSEDQEQDRMDQYEQESTEKIKHS